MKFKDNFYTILFVVSLTLFTMTVANELKNNKPEFVKIEVQPGDTIWEYSELFKEHHNLSSADFIEWVEENNYIFDGTIKVGQTLILPVDENKEIGRAHV